jgi:hypothetical protein
VAARDFLVDGGVGAVDAGVGVAVGGGVGCEDVAGRLTGGRLGPHLLNAGFASPGRK